MSPLSDTPDDNERGLEAIADRLETERPVPRAMFRGELRRSLMAELEGAIARPDHLGLAICAYSGSGFTLLIVACLGLLGAGPLAA